MRLIESYSRSASVEIKNKPFVMEKFFPLPSEIKKYITIQNSSGMPAKDYGFFQEVIDLVSPELQRNGIYIILIGAKDTKPLNNVINLLGQTSIQQSCYLIRNSSLHIGNDSWAAHYAGAVNTPLISLYGPTTIKNHAPYHYNKDKTIFFESHRDGKSPSFSREEHTKTINLINPEEISKAICKILDLNFSFNYSTITIGENYGNKILESAVDGVVDVKKLGAESIIMRMDINNNLSVLQNQLKLNPCQIITDAEIPIEVLKIYKNNILGIIYKITKNHNPNFIKTLIQEKIGYQLISDLNEEELKDIKLEYMELGIIINSKIDMPEKLKGKDFGNLYIKTGKLLLGRGVFYNSYQSYINSNSFNPSDLNPQKVNINNINLLWRESDFIMFMEKNNLP